MKAVLTATLALALVLAPASLAQASDGGAGWPDRDYGSRGVVRIDVPAGVTAQDVVVRPSGASLALASGPSGTYAWRISADGVATALAGEDARLTGGEFRGVRILDAPGGGWYVVGNIERGKRAHPAVMQVNAKGSKRDVTGEVFGLEANTPVRVTDAVLDPGSNGTRVIFVGWSGGRERVARIATLGRWDREGMILQSWTGGIGATWLSSLTADASGDFLATGSARDPQGGYGYPLLKFDRQLRLIDGFPNNVLLDPRELCQFSMADIAVVGSDNVVAGSAWACQPIPDARAALIAQQFPTGYSNEPFGSYGEHQGEGAVAFNFLSGIDWGARAVAVDSQGRLVVVGTAQYTPPGGLGAGILTEVTRPRPLSARLSSTGDFDTDFAINTLARANGAWNWSGVDVGLDSRDQPTLIGTATRGGRTQIRVVRLQG